MKVCPKCGKVVGFNSYFGAYICDDCGWEDDTYNQMRIQYYAKRSCSVSATLQLKEENSLKLIHCNNFKNNN